MHAPAPAVVFIHGALHDHTIWGALPAQFAELGWRVLAPDLPAHGEQPGPALRSVAAMSAWLLSLLDAEAVGDALFIGHSMGALIALEVARIAPARVRQIAMLGVAYPMKVSDTLLAAALDDQERAIELVNGWSHSAAAGAAILAHARSLMRRVAGGTTEPLLHIDLAACKTYADGEAAARSLACPALFILGSADHMTPPRACAALISWVPHARVYTLDAGHALMEERPDEVRAALMNLARGGALA